MKTYLQRGRDEVREASELVKRLRAAQKSRGLTNRQFVEFCNQSGAELNLRVYGNWLSESGNLPRRSTFETIRVALRAAEAVPEPVAA